MKVTLIASTNIELVTESYGPREDGLYSLDINNATEEWMEDDKSDTDADTLAEFSGRACYQAWEKKNPKTAHNAGYLANIIDHGHFSVLEHASATFYIEGVSRALTHELIRHRHLSYSELSQRFVNMDEAEMVEPPAFEHLSGWGCKEGFYYTKEEAQKAYSDIVRRLTDAGLTRKQAREAARAVMPNATETKIVVTGNMRAWRDVLHKRYSTHADAEIRELATELLRQLREIAPNSFQDFPDEPFKD